MFQYLANESDKTYRAISFEDEESTLGLGTVMASTTFQEVEHGGGEGKQKTMSQRYDNKVLTHCRNTIKGIS